MSEAQPPWPSHLGPFFASQGVASVASVAQLQAQHQVSARWSTATVHELLTFYVASQLHALSIREVGEVAKLPPLTRVPRLQRGVLGVMSLRGNVVPVVDVAHFFEPAPAGGPQAQAANEGRPAPSHLVVLGEEGALLGLAVGRIVGVHRLPSEAVVGRTPRGHEQQGAFEPCIEGFATTSQGATVVVLQALALQRRFATL